MVFAFSVHDDTLQSHRLALMLAKDVSVRLLPCLEASATVQKDVERYFDAWLD